MAGTGAGWISGVVKAVPSGDSVVIMGNTGQVRYWCHVHARLEKVHTREIRGTSV
jgi:hypothetical protein|tara:strand:+ start:5910 stop:6074 length:165 start_codon:yes stop_codon:yes gene_type:complete